jgi:hypothetical protein
MAQLVADDVRSRAPAGEVGAKNAKLMKALTGIPAVDALIKSGDANLVGAKGLSVSLNERIDNLEKGLSALHEELNRVEMAVDRLLGADKLLNPPPVSESPKLDCFADRLTELAARMASLYGRVARLGNRLNAAV